MSEQVTTNTLVNDLRELPEKLRRTPVALSTHVRLLQGAADEIERLQADRDAAQIENIEQSRLLGMSAERELALRAEIERLRASHEPGTAHASHCALVAGPTTEWQRQFGVAGCTCGGVPAPPPSAWQPIEAAPKDREILVCGGTIESNDGWSAPLPCKSASIAYWYRNHWRGEDCQAHDEWLVHEPTHWMPLPSPPQTKSECHIVGCTIQGRHEHKIDGPFQETSDE